MAWFEDVQGTYTKRSKARARKAESNAMTPIRAAWFATGGVALSLGALGVALPLLPTTPFLLLAAFAFARSSDRSHAWLLRHRTFGPLIENWRRHGALDRRSKVIGTLSMAIAFGVSLILDVAPAVLAVQAVVLTVAAAYVLSRPAPPRP